MIELHRSEEIKKILGVDSSTTGVAWTLIEIQDGNPVPVKWGKIDLTKKKEVYDKMKVVGEEFVPLVRELSPDHIFVEKSIFVKNPDTARKLSFVVGALMLVAAMENYPLTLVEPASWKSHLGYFNLTRKFQAEAVRILGTTEGKKICDRFRKEQTKRILAHRFPDFDISDHDIADSCGVAVYGVNKIAAQILFEKNREIAFDCRELAQIGLEI